MGLLLKNGRVIDPSQGLDAERDVLLEDGRVARIERGLVAGAHEVIDCADRVVCPGFIDLHVHLRDPGQEYKETIATGTRAAAAGGFTHVGCMPNTDPPIDDPSVVHLIQERARRACGVKVHVYGALSKANEGRELSELGRLADAGVTLFSDDAFPIQNSQLMRRAMEYARMLHRGVTLHCEDKALSADGVMNEGEVATLLGLRGVPHAAEDVHVARNIELCRLTGCRLHICHVATAGTVALVRRAKAEGLPVTAEADPHHFCLTDEACLGYNTNAKVNPPLRTAHDVAAVQEGLADDTLDCIATDHAPHASHEKECEFDRALFGLVGLETAVSLTLDKLVRAGILTLLQAVERLATNPARVLTGDGRRLPPEVDPLLGTLQPGAPADVTILDLDRPVRVEAERLYSKGKNTPFLGWEMIGAPAVTIAGGRVLMRDGRIAGDEG
ncbi:MAG: dihydroorotase [Armatimonadetes bacterium]|nr:dihydroorotase [Armatimonadota bacterium]